MRNKQTYKHTTNMANKFGRMSNPNASELVNSPLSKFSAISYEYESVHS